MFCVLVGVLSFVLCDAVFIFAYCCELLCVFVFVCLCACVCVFGCVFNCCYCCFWLLVFVYLSVRVFVIVSDLFVFVRVCVLL